MEKIDRISSLPDDLLCRILSRLPTKYVVPTTVLSTRWKNLFTSVPDLHFDDSETTDAIAFSSYVFKVLCAVLTKTRYIRKFHLNCQRGTYLASMISLWICAVSGHNLQELIVRAKTLMEPTPLPPELFNCRSLTLLILAGKFFLCVPHYVFLPNLKTLRLSELVITDNESVRMFLGGCIVLKELYLSECVIDSISVLEVSVASLKSLTLYNINGDYEFRLDAPSLEYFDCESYATRGYYGDKLNSLVRASVGTELEDEHFPDEKVCQLVNMVSNARSLALWHDSLEPLIYQTAIFHNLTRLTVSFTRAGGLLSLPNLLRNAPCLEVLSFDGGLRDDDGIFLEPASYLPEPIPVCVSDHLKEVEVEYFHGEEYELKMVEYFLRNAKVLEKMTISPSPSYRSSDPQICRVLSMKKQFPTARRLLKLPRCSRACQIIFTDVYY